MEQEAPPPPAAIAASHEAKSSRFLHSFGYHLAIQLVGKNPIHTCIREAYDDLRQQEQQQSSLQTADNDVALFHAFRSNWRSNARFPWQLPVTSSRVKGKGSDNHSIQSLFVDITFDFLIIPANLAVLDNSSMIHSFHLLEGKNFWIEADHPFKSDANSFPIAISVAIRVGALLALPAPQINDNVTCSTAKITGDDERVNNVWSFKKSIKDDGYRYYYHRGNTVLTMSDLNEHCKSIDIVLEEMAPFDVARIFGDAFIEGCKRGDSWEITSKEWNATNNERYSVLDSRQLEHGLDQARYYIKLHHGVIQADGVLPLSGSRNNGDGDGGHMELISRSMLDMILLQSKCSGCDGICVAVPRSDAVALWREIDSRIVSELENQREELHRKQLNSTRDISMQASVITSIANDSNPDGTVASAKLIDANKYNETRNNSSSYNTGKSLLSKPPQPPNESALFARVKATTQGGTRKKPKFRLGPA